VSTLLKRVLSAIVLIACLIALIYVGGVSIWIALSLVAVIAQWELGKALGYTDKESGKLKILIFGMIVSILMYASCYLADYKVSLILFPAVYLIILFAIYVFNFGKYSAKDVASYLFIFAYIAVSLSFIPIIRESFEQGRYLVWLILIPPISSDTFAYFVGSAIGKHKMAPVVSPKKSIEGSVGGVIGAAVVTGIFGYYVSTVMNVTNGFVIACAVIGLVVGGVSQIGDLAASAIKREYGIKDYGKLIPGHGGALDRVDSILYVAPIVYFGVVLLTTYFV